MGRRILLAAALTLALAPSIALAGEAKKKEGAAAAPTVTYMALSPLNISIAKLIGGRTVLTVEVGLDIPDPALNAQAALLTPRLTAAYLETLQAFGAGLLPGAPPNADLLAEKLQQSTDKTLGKPGARLLIGSIVVN
ncbi:MAG: hypothetical protein JWM33_3034 [Caulobacteraceae bacterium]|nr:hypothetical protein [Caulobacteraceae bacterium]